MSASATSKQKTIAPSVTEDVSAPSAPSCASCQYAKPHAATDNFLFCRRHPPIPSVSNFHANFPIVSTGDWCGDFAALEEVGAPAAPVNVDVPYCSQAGEVLSCTMGNWTNEPTSYAYKWNQDGNDVGSDSDTYTVSSADANTTFICTVTASNTAGSTVAPASNAVVVTDPTTRDSTESTLRTGPPSPRTRNNRHR